MAEVTAKTVMPTEPPGVGVGQFRVVLFVQGTSAVNNDTLTVTGLTTVQGAYLVSSTGVAGTLTFATNVITITNGSTLVWSGLVWGT